MNMRRILAVALLICGGAALGAELEGYTSKEHAFSLQVPTSWEKKERISGSAVTVMAPKGEGKDSFRANVNVIEQDIPSDTDLKKFSDASLSVMDKLLKDYKEIERKEVTIGAIKAVRVVYTYSFEDYPLKAILILAVNGKNGYAITGSADSATFDTFKQAFDDIMFSFAPTK